ncbi:hypothetical protein E4K10_43100 [Streptomyces sp. T1317-0309]|nr:hypothetical protein E4K10_43100 [Streptomyces sp. T1317-0309]
MQAGASTVLAELMAMGSRAFPRDEIQSLARKAAPGSGWLYELQMGLMELNEDPECVVQFGACSLADINHYLGVASGAEGDGNHIAAYEAEKRSGNVGADWVIWRPVASGGDISAGAQTAGVYTGEFVQAKQTVERNFAGNLKAAAFQLEGKNAARQGNATTEPELTLRSGTGSANRHREPLPCKSPTTSGTCAKSRSPLTRYSRSLVAETRGPMSTASSWKRQRRVAGARCTRSTAEGW